MQVQKNISLLVSGLLVLMIGVSCTLLSNLRKTEEPVEINSEKDFPCTFEIEAAEDGMSYFEDFVIKVTNTSNHVAYIQHFDGLPCDLTITFVSTGNSFELQHKYKAYTEQKGGTRAPEIFFISPLETTEFSIDLKGDYVIETMEDEIKQHVIPFRDFANNIKGTILVKVNPDPDQTFFVKDSAPRVIQWDGKSIIIPGPKLGKKHTEQLKSE